MAKRTLITRLAVLGLGIALLSSRSARADERTEARAHFKKGMASIADGRYEAGIEELKKAYDIIPHPNVLYNIARASLDMGDLENAQLFFRKYLEGNPKDSDEVAQIVASLEDRIRRQQAQLLESQQDGTSLRLTTPPSADVPSAPPERGRNDERTSLRLTTPPSADVPSAPPVTNPPPGTAAGTTPGPSPAGAPVAPRASAAGADAASASRAATVGPALLARQAAASNASDLKTEGVFEETIVTASKTAQSPLDAPSSTSIVTEQDIRLSGITKIPELLRRLAGVDIMETTGSQTEVSLRGYNQRLSNKVLVLVDGRSVYLDLVGATLWGTLSIGVEDIERIEVVRGPGSALYGADAFNGVINIITRQPGHGGSGVNVGLGDRDTAHGTLWTSGGDKSLAFRVSAGFDNVPRWSREVPPGRADLVVSTDDQNTAQRSLRLDGTVTHQLGKEALIGVQGGYTYDSTYELLAIGPINDLLLSPIATSDVAAFLESKHALARVFWNNTSLENANNAAYVGQTLFPGRGRFDVVDGEAQYVDQLETGKGIVHDFHVGGEYRLKRVTWTFLAQTETEHHFGLFVHDEVRFGPRLAIVGDYRADYVPYLDRWVQSPRGSILFHPTKQSTLRAIVATAFRTPTYLESYLSVPVPLPISGGTLLSESAPVDNPAFRLQPEQIFTTELGYLNSESDSFTLDSAFFYTHVNNLIELTSSRPVTVGDLANTPSAAEPNSSTGYYPLFLAGWQNACRRYDTYGAEIGLRTFPIEGLDVYANYTFMDVRQNNDGCTAAESAGDARTSAHKLNAGVQLRSSVGLDGSIDFHYVSPQDWAEQVENVQKQRVEYQTFHLDAYALVNASIGYRFLRNQAEIRAAVFNVLDNRHREHPFGQAIDRREMAYLSYRF